METFNFFAVLIITFYILIQEFRKRFYININTKYSWFELWKIIYQNIYGHYAKGIIIWHKKI